MLPVPEDHVAHVANAQAVHQDVAHRHLSGDLRGDFAALFSQLQNVSRAENKDPVAPVAQLFCDLGLGDQMPVFAVDRNGDLWLDQGIDQLDVLLAGMAGYVHVLEDHVGPL